MFTKIESPFHSLSMNTLGRELQRALRRPARRAPQGAQWGVPLNVQRTDDAVHIRLAVPGSTADDVQIDVEGRTLRVRVARPIRELPGKRTLRERPLGDVTRIVDIPPDVDTTAIHATYRHGVLDIELPLRARRTIDIAIDVA